jgi:hypothetical protein
MPNARTIYQHPTIRRESSANPIDPLDLVMLARRFRLYSVLHSMRRNGGEGFFLGVIASGATSTPERSAR